MLHDLSFFLDKATWEASSSHYFLQLKTKEVFLHPPHTAVADITAAKHSIYSEKRCRTNLKRPGRQLPVDSHLRNKTGVLMGTVSGNAPEPQAGDASRTGDLTGGWVQDSYLTRFAVTPSAFNRFKN